MTSSNFNLVQNKLHQILEKFINGSLFTKKAKILYPFSKSVNISGVEDFIIQINGVLGVDLMPKTNNEMAEYISTIYKILLNSKFSRAIIENKDIKCKYNYDKDKYKSGKKQIINNLIQFLELKGVYEYLDLFLIHGSYSTLDCKDNISDLDTLILINDATLLNSSKLIELQAIVYDSLEYFYEIDILQHHGYFILTTFDINYYNETFFPTMLFDYSTSVYQSQESFNFKLRDSCFERKLILDSTLNYIKETNPQELNDLMTYKIYFQVIQLIPIAYLQYIGKNTYKKYSFELFLEDFPKYSIFFKDIYNIRLKWKQNTIKDYKVFNWLNILKNRHFLFINSKIEKTPHTLKNKLGTKQHQNILIPLVKEIKTKLKDKGIVSENI